MAESSEIQNLVLKKLVTAIKWILFQCQILGLVTCSFGSQGFRASAWRRTLNVVTSVIYIVLIFWCMRFVHNRPDDTVVTKITTVLLLGIAAAHITVLWISGVTCCDNVTKFLQQIVDVDVILQKNRIIVDYEKTRRNIWVQTLARSVLFALCFMVCQPMGLFQETYFTEWISSGVYLFMVAINFTMCHLLIQLILLLKARFVILNKHIKLFKKKGLALEKICALHHKLSKSIKHFNETFGVILLSTFGLNFLANVLSLLLLAVQMQQDEIKWLRVSYEALGFLVFGIDPLWICHVCHSTVSELNKARELIYRIVTEDQKVMDIVEMFSLQIANERAEFTAAGFFAINYSLVFSIVGGLATYMIILIQLSATLAQSSEL